MGTCNLPASIPPSRRLLSTAAFHSPADVPLEIKSFARIDNLQTRRTYKNALEDFMKFTASSDRMTFGKSAVPTSLPVRKFYLSLVSKKGELKQDLKRYGTFLAH
jgi:hypothetical protein